MKKSVKLILSLIGLLIVLQFILILILFTRDSIEPATSSFLNQDSTTSISSEHAKEAAHNYVRHGTVGDVTFINENGAQIYAVNINYGNTDYVVYIHGNTGDVVWLTRENSGYEDITIFPDE